MEQIRTKDGKRILLAMVKAIQTHKDYLSEIDGLIGDGDHGVNMNKGFSIFEDRYSDTEFTFQEGLQDLGEILFGEIGGSMGPIYGTIFMEMANAAEGDIDLKSLAVMLGNGLGGLLEIIDARTGDKTLVDTLAPAVRTLQDGAEKGSSFSECLAEMKAAAKAGWESTKEMTARYGRSSRLGERSRGVPDAGATSCYLLLEAMADAMTELLEENPQGPGQRGTV